MNKDIIKFKSTISFVLILVALLLVFTFSACIISYSSLPINYADAYFGNDPFTLLPLKSGEYFSLNKPVFAYSDDEVTAISTENRELIIFNDGKYVKTVTSSTPLKQITRIGDYFLYSDNQTITSIRIDGVKDENSKKLTYEDAANETKDLNCVYFNVAEKDGKHLLATITNGNLLIFIINNDLEATLYETIENGIPADDAPVAINAGSVFYVSGGKIMRRDLGDLTNEIEQAEGNPSDMIANGEYVYFIRERIIYSFKITNETPTIKALDFEETPFELGKATKPSGLSFKGDKLLVTDNLVKGSVQEFEIKDGELFFTGYAIASGLSAYNRIAENPDDVQISGDFVAVKDDFKITIIDLKGNGYDRERFQNLCVGNVPKLFAIGNGTIIYYNNQTVTAIDLKTNATTDILDNVLNARALSYTSGKFYVACPDGSKTSVTVISEKDMFTDSENSVSTLAPYTNVSSVNLIATDVFGNVYCADNYAIYKNGNTLIETSVDKIDTDLGGKLFALKNGKIVCYDDQTGDFYTVFDHDTGSVYSFGIDIINDALTFSLKDKEGVFLTLSAENSALNQAKPTEEFNTFSEQINELKLYAVRENANLYSVISDSENFIYTGLTDITEENAYPIIAKIVLPYGPCLYALASKTGVLLADERELSEKPAYYYSAEDTPNIAYVSTKVYAYAIPLTVKGATFALTENGNAVILEKGIELEIKDKFRLNDADFYRVTTDINGTKTYCYVPVAFTQKILTENFTPETYSIEIIDKTTLYVDKEFSEALMEIEKGVAVKVLEKSDKYIKIAVETTTGEAIGYIKPNAILGDPKISVRNVLIVLALVASLCGTFTFVALRKKR